MPYSAQVVEAVAFVRSTDQTLFPPAQFPDAIEDSTSGASAPDIEILSSAFAWTEHGYGPVPAGDLASIGAVLLRYSRVPSNGVSAWY